MMKLSVKSKLRSVIALAIVFVSACQNPVPEDVGTFDLEEIDVAGLQQLMSSGQQTSVTITQAYIDQIKKVDSQLHSVLEINPDALEIAQLLDAERSEGNIRSPLHGIPVLIKDNIDTADKMLTTAGSLALVDAPTPKEDAFVVKQLRDAGAIILGKTNLSEWANFRSSRSSSGWSSRGGQTHNPYVLNRTPCGSSSGSAVAVAANLTVLAIGTETDGSIICPSANNNVVGIKPSLGLVSRSGIIPIAHSQDTAGPMARSVKDAVTLLDVLIGRDDADPITTDRDMNTQLTDYLDVSGLKNKRIGVVQQYMGTNDRLNNFLDSKFKVMRQAGATLVDVDVEKLREISVSEYQVLLYEFKNDLNKYFQQRGSSVNSLQALINFNNQHAESVMPYFGQDVLEAAVEKEGLDAEEYKQALLNSKRLAQAEGIDKVMDQYDLDALLALSNSTPWLIDLINGDSPTAYVSSSMLAAVSGYPSITVPAGFIEGFPIGISFFGKEFSEPTLIEIAYSFEQLNPARQPPTFTPSYEGLIE